MAKKKTDFESTRRYSDEYGEMFGNEVITKANVAESAYELSLRFGANKNLYRSCPSLQDGCKPSRRRMLYTWWLTEHCPENTKPETLKKLSFLKAANISEGTGIIHPHGTTAIAEMLGRDGQYWSNNVMLIVKQGAYGNMRGDSPAAERYREAKLSEYTIDCFFDDFSKYCVTMRVAYDGKHKEPEFLPAKYPHILINPQFSGIGWGMASNIPPFNFAEVMDATIALIKDPNAKIMLIPDSPTGCDVIDEGLFKEMNKTGQSKVTFRATTEIDYANNIIKITSLPLDSSSKEVIASIITKRETKKLFTEIVEIKDETVEGEVSILLYLKPDVQPDKVLKQLFKKDTGLKSTKPVNIVVIDDFHEYEYGIKDLLLEWIAYRIDVVRSMALNSLQQITTRQQMNEVLLMVFSKDNIDTTIKIAKESKSRKETIERYMKTFKINSLQAATIADMHVYNFNSESYNNYKEEKLKINEELKNINDMLSNDSKIEEFIIKQLEEGKKKYGRPRKSKIVKENSKNDNNIPDTEHLIGVSETGFIKKLSLKDNTSIGPVGKTSSNLTVLHVNNRENLLVVDSKGNLTKISISGIPDMNFEDIGVELQKFFPVKGDIKTIMELPSMDILKVKDESIGIIFITKLGFAKRVQLSEFKKIVDSKIGITLNKGDEVAAAMFSFDSSIKDIVISTNLGNGIRLSIKDINTFSAQAKGSNIVSLKDGEEVVSASLVNPKKKLLFYVTTSGRVKITEMKFFPTMNKKGETVNLISLQGNETLVGVASVDKNDSVMIYKKKSDPELIEVKSLEPSTRVSKGDKLIKTNNGDSVVAFKVFKA